MARSGRDDAGDGGDDGDGTGDGYIRRRRCCCLAAKDEAAATAMSFRRCLDSGTAVCCAEQRIFFVRQPIKIISECYKDKMILKETY